MMDKKRIGLNMMKVDTSHTLCSYFKSPLVLQLNTHTHTHMLTHTRTFFWSIANCKFANVLVCSVRDVDGCFLLTTHPVPVCVCSADYRVLAGLMLLNWTILRRARLSCIPYEA